MEELEQSLLYQVSCFLMFIRYEPFSYKNLKIQKMDKIEISISYIRSILYKVPKRRMKTEKKNYRMDDCIG